MFKFFKKKNDIKNSDNNIEHQQNNWYSNRYNLIVIQRNVLLLLLLLLFGVITISIVTILKVSTSKTIEPFVVEIEKKSGIVTLVNPITVKQYSADEVLNNHFIVEYIRIRELFDPNNFQYNYHIKVRMFSTQKIYTEFRNFINPNNVNSPVNLYANVSDSKLKIRSIQNLSPGQVQVRFTLEFNEKNGNIIKKDKIATLSFEYVSMEMNEQQRYINPLGFRITYYRSDNEFL
ncbi:MAG: type IV secretion system protein [Wolbachia endosymbiont of Xenopsylla cheopis]